jgi:hypothetical protein
LNDSFNVKYLEDLGLRRSFKSFMETIQQIQEKDTSIDLKNDANKSLDGSIHPLGSLRIHIHGIAYIVNYTMI